MRKKFLAAAFSANGKILSTDGMNGEETDTYTHCVSLYA